MPLSTHHRNDRRRRVIRETIAADADFAVESARASRRARRPAAGTADDFLADRDPGYSHAVRKTCQHRWVQLIPVRHASLSMVIAGLWLLWGVLLTSHYWFHVRANTDGRSPLLILQLFDIRSPHSIANWMTCQLWMLTAMVAWMIYQIRKHKLDDFRAKYRVWIALTGVAIFSSFDASTSCLYLLGQSIDGWTRREIGYGGWPLVLATYASLVGLLGIRLSSELKSTPAALSLWFMGLLAWASAALLGTGLLKLEWSPGTIDLVVGGCWLGGVLAVFQAAGLVLRHCYLQAQKRFVERTVLNPAGRNIAWPSWMLRNGSIGEGGVDGSPRKKASDDKGGAADDESWKEPSPGMLVAISRRLGLPWGRSESLGDEEGADEDSDIDDDNSESVGRARDSRSNAKSVSKSSAKEPARESPKALEEPKRPMRLFGWIPHRSECNEAQIPDEPLRVDDGGEVDQGLTKKPGWFGIGGHRAAASAPSSRATPSTHSSSTQTNSSQSVRPSAGIDSDGEAKSKKRAWLPKWGRSGSAADPNENGSGDQASIKSPSSKPSTKSAESSKGTTSAESPLSKSSTPANANSNEPASGAAAANKKSWFGFGKKGGKPSEAIDIQASGESRAATAAPTAAKPKPVASGSDGNAKEGKPKKLAGRLMGWIDGLKLKPPVDDGSLKPVSNASSAKGNSTRSDAGESQAKPVPVSSSTSQRPLPSTQANVAASSAASSDTSYGDGNEEEESNDYRQLSKAERKRLRRQQNDRDAA
jgi:hypothetical protein